MRVTIGDRLQALVDALTDRLRAEPPKHTGEDHLAAALAHARAALTAYHDLQSALDGLTAELRAHYDRPAQ